MTSNVDEFERLVLELVEKTLEVQQKLQRDFVIAQTKDDLPLRERVLAIIDPDHQRLLPTGGAHQHASDLLMPDSIGAYRIEREIGRGGMGVVYAGRRMTEEFDLVAAIKVVRTGMTSPRLVERLRAERRMLARLKHPNIAQMYDGGETEHGAPYFVMEYVEGKPMSEYLSSGVISLNERLKIFKAICAGVSFAHRNLVIHRDLSPANILVPDDGHVKLIDFGIAHSFGDVQSSGPKMTMTKGYAAPERREGAEASTVMDVYSLGIILEEMCEDIDAPRLSDLRAIFAKATKKTPDKRYQSVDALVSDIVAYQQGETVDAVGGGWVYVLRRFAGRRKIAVTAGVLGVISIMAASIIMSVLYIRAEAAEQRAVERFEEVRELAGFIMFDFHDEVAKLEGSTVAREMLVNTALDYLDTLSATPGSTIGLKLENALGYKRLSEVTGNAQFPNLGHRADATALIEKAASQITKLRETEAPNAEILRAYIEIIYAKAALEGLTNNRMQSAFAILEKAREASIELRSFGPMSLEDLLADAFLDNTYGYYRQSLGETKEAVKSLKLGVSKYQEIVDAHPKSMKAQVGLARANVTLAEAMAWDIYYQAGEASGDYGPTLPYFDAGITVLRKLLMEKDATLEMKTQLVIGLLKRANTTCSFEGHEKAGMADLEEALILADSLIMSDPNNNRIADQRIYVLKQQVECFQNLGLFSDAISAGEKALSSRKALVENEPDNMTHLKHLANIWSVLTQLHIRTDAWEKACQSTAENLETWRYYGEFQSELTRFEQNEKKLMQDIWVQCEERGFS